MPVAWGTAILNYVWWIEIAQGGTFISAVLLLFHQKWRTSVNRFTEAMTIFALACAGLFPLLHLGRPQYAFFLAPYPNTLGMWPQFVSPLVWDFFAVSIYGTISVLFWYLGMIPDLATLRDSTDRKWLRRLYSVACFGWRNSATHWHHYETTYKVIAALAAPLVISVHSIVGLDFAYTIVPGWHSTIFPPFFVVGAIFSGFAMVLTLMVPIRAIYGLKGLITANHIANMAKLLLLMGMFVLFGHLSEYFMAWYSGDIYEQYQTAQQALGTYSWAFYVSMGCTALAIQPLWLDAGAPESAAALSHLDPGQRGHVGRAVPQHRRQPAPRLPDLLVGSLPPDVLGLEHVHRHVRIVLHDALPVPAPAAHRLHVRGARPDPRAKPPMTEDGQP